MFECAKRIHTYFHFLNEIIPGDWDRHSDRSRDDSPARRTRTLHIKSIEGATFPLGRGTSSNVGRVLSQQNAAPLCLYIKVRAVQHPRLQKCARFNIRGLGVVLMKHQVRGVGFTPKETLQKETSQKTSYLRPRVAGPLHIQPSFASQRQPQPA